MLDQIDVEEVVRGESGVLDLKRVDGLVDGCLGRGREGIAGSEQVKDPR